VIESLTRIKSTENRKFSFVEMVYFSRYWNDISPKQRHTLRKLVLDKKLHFISGGWVMNDEATPHYSMIIDQMTLGHHWINCTFGPKFLPKIGWQIDPFGHSKEYASILSQMGFNGLYLGRIDFQVIKIPEIFGELPL
jgi:lysosomal alpha-mannosidase